MASIDICDGCSRPLVGDEQFVSRGRVNVVSYCSACAKAFDGFAEARDSVHTDLVNQWNKKIGKLKEDFAINHPRLTFPDE